MWQMANQGPKSGEAGHFKRAAAAGTNGDLAYARRRFDDEVNRIYGVMNQRLSDRRYLAGADYTIADMISYPWATLSTYLDQSLDEFVHVQRWLAEIGERPATKRAMAVGDDQREDPATISAEEQERRAKVLHNQRARPLRNG
jgi:GST-like protein